MKGKKGAIHKPFYFFFIWIIQKEYVHLHTKMRFDYEKEDFNNEPIMLYGYGC